MSLASNEEPDARGPCLLDADGTRTLGSQGPLQSSTMALAARAVGPKVTMRPLDVRVKQHQAILDEGMLDLSWTVMGIWPAPMIYAGPTEVQFHAASRRAGGASFFVVGRDAAGIKGSSVAVTHTDDDMYDANHARSVLQASPLLDDGVMQLLSLDKFFYDKTDHQMKAMDPSREDDFISISGSKMRALARQGAVPCARSYSSDLLAANCVPQGFMVPTGWAIVCDYYQNVDSGKFVPWSKRVAYNEDRATDAVEEGGSHYLVLLVPVVQWSYNGLALARHSLRSGSHYNFITETPIIRQKWRSPRKSTGTPSCRTRTRMGRLDIIPTACPSSTTGYYRRPGRTLLSNRPKGTVVTMIL